MYTSLEIFGQYVRLHRFRKGMNQNQLSLKVFNAPNGEYIGRLERGQLAGLTFATAEKIRFALDSKMNFERYPTYIPDLHRR
jgi:hypothetical protein